MRFAVGILFGMAVIAICINWNGSTHGRLNAAESNADLKQQVEKLEARVAALEAALASSVLRNVVPQPYSNRVLPNEPKHWSKREFNGQPFYIVPLGDTPESKATSTKQLP